MIKNIVANVITVSQTNLTGNDMAALSLVASRTMHPLSAYNISLKVLF